MTDLLILLFSSLLLFWSFLNFSENQTSLVGAVASFFAAILASVCTGRLFVHIFEWIYFDAERDKELLGSNRARRWELSRSTNFSLATTATPTVFIPVGKLSSVSFSVVPKSVLF